MTTDTFFINGYDARVRYGISFDDAAVSALLTPAPAKERIKNKVRTKTGTAVTTSPDTEKMDERTLSIGMNIHAEDKDDFFAKYALFCREVLKGGWMHLATSYIPGAEYKCLYESCTQFQEYRFQIGKYALKLSEPDPDDREPRYSAVDSEGVGYARKSPSGEGWYERKSIKGGIYYLRSGDSEVVYNKTYYTRDD